MSKKIILFLAVLLAATLVLSACERSAVIPQTQATATTGGGTGTTPTVPLTDAYKTQTTSFAYTALALTMQPGGSTFGATPTPGTGTMEATITGMFDVSPTATHNPLVPTSPGNPYAPTPTPGIPATYTLQQGEYPYCIARRFNVDQEELLTLNNLTDGAVYQPGLVLQIPQTGHTFIGERTLRTHPASYIVQLNDTIYRVACTFGDVDPIYLAAYNNLASPYLISTGQTLYIP